MSNKLVAQHIAPTDLMLTDTGELYVYISDVLADGDNPACKAALEWAICAVNEEGVRENNLALTFDLPAAVEEVLEFYNEGTPEAIRIQTIVQPKMDALKAKLEAALRVFDRVTYIE